jgi:hypothetical protein
MLARGGELRVSVKWRASLRMLMVVVTSVGMDAPATLRRGDQQGAAAGECDSRSALGLVGSCCSSVSVPRGEQGGSADTRLGLLSLRAPRGLLQEGGAAVVGEGGPAVAAVGEPA